MASVIIYLNSYANGNCVLIDSQTFPYSRRQASTGQRKPTIPDFEYSGELERVRQIVLKRSSRQVLRRDDLQGGQSEMCIEHEMPTADAYLLGQSHWRLRDSQVQPDVF